MVGPPRRDRGRGTNATRLKAGIVALVALSGGLMALYGDAGLEVVAAVTLAGGVLGGVLVWYLARIARQVE